MLILPVIYFTNTKFTIYVVERGSTNDVMMYDKKDDQNYHKESDVFILHHNK